MERTLFSYSRGYQCEWPRIILINNRNNGADFLASYSLLLGVYIVRELSESPDEYPAIANQLDLYWSIFYQNRCPLDSVHIFPWLKDYKPGGLVFWWSLVLLSILGGDPVTTNTTPSGSTTNLA